MKRNRPRGIVSIALAALLLFTAVAATVPARAQDEPAGDGTDIQPTPGIVTAATPEAGLTYVPQEFAGGRWRVAVATARIGAEFPEFELPEVDQKLWIVVIADVTNWSRGDARLDPRDFTIRIPGDPDHRGFARRSTEGTAAVLGLQPEVVADRVEIDAGETERLALVFQVTSDTANHALMIDGQALPLIPAYSGAPFDELPDVIEPPSTQLQLLTDVASGSTIEIESGDDVTELALGFVDAPNAGECYSLQSTARLDRMSTERILVETDRDVAFVWAELEDGTRRLLNHEQISGGYAALDRNAGGRFHVWLADSEQLAKNQSAGLWSDCTGPHGIELPQAVQSTQLDVATDTGTTPVRPWIQWSPDIVTTPDGGAWAFFSATAEEGPNAETQRLYAAQYDPTQGEWLPAEAMEGGEIQFGGSAVVDSKGNVHVVYSARESADPEDFSTLLYTHQTDDGSWAEWEVVAADQLAGHQLAPALAIDRNDKLYVVWQDQRAFDSAARFASPANSDIFMSEREPDGEWSPVPTIVNVHYPTSAASRPVLVVDGDRLIAAWSVYTSALGLESAARLEWAVRPINAALDDWETPRALAAVRGDVMGGRFLDMAADPTGGAVLVYGRQGVEAFLFMKRLKPGAVDWTDDTLIAFGDKGSYPSVTVNQEGTVFVAYHVSLGSLVKIGATAVSFRSVEPGPEIILTQQDPNTQGFPSMTTDVTGRPWLVFYGEIPGLDPSLVTTLRNARVPSIPVTGSQAPTATPSPATDTDTETETELQDATPTPAG